MTTEEIIAAYRNAVGDSSVLTRLAKKGTYSSARQFAVEAAKVLNSTYANSIGERITIDIAQEIVAPLFSEVFTQVEGAVRTAQLAMNKKIGLGISEQIAKRPNVVNMAMDMVGKPGIDSEEFMTHANDWLDRTAYKHSATVSDAAPDVKSYLVRTYDGRGLDRDKKVTAKNGTVYDYGNEFATDCEYCTSKEGRYETKSAPREFFKRHKGCNCTIDPEFIRGVNSRILRR